MLLLFNFVGFSTNVSLAIDSIILPLNFIRTKMIKKKIKKNMADKALKL